VRELESDFGQGYWFSRPVDPATIERLLSGEPSNHGLRAA
jgi:EAL domain-containing protein (putative c-di-GMP-specific phosphodiesterase class I)